MRSSSRKKAIAAQLALGYLVIEDPRSQMPELMMPDDLA
jgi:hypothetical protein